MSYAALNVHLNFNMTNSNRTNPSNWFLPSVPAAMAMVDNWLTNGSKDLYAQARINSHSAFQKHLPLMFPQSISFEAL